ncbi:MAG: DUF5596 domain-containing protein [Spirochaetes bacterium]|nr:DUF5596 domain-containing protein [Spirochaetota bacterium]
MELNDVLAELGITDRIDAFSPGWKESVACYPYPHPSFLNPPHIIAARNMAHLDPAVDGALIRTAGIISLKPALSFFIWHCYRLLFFKQDYFQFSKWPKLTRVLGDDWGVFYLLIILDSVKRTVAYHHARGIPEAVTEGVLADYGIGVARFARFHGGLIGTPHTHIGWYRNHPGGGLYRLGRLQYVPNPCRYAVRMFRHAATGETLMLSEPEIKYTGDGFIDSIAGHEDKEHGWISSLDYDGEHIIGNPILPTGRALRRKIRIPARVWNDAVKRDDTLLAMHIPEGGGMGMDVCKSSMEETLSFFPKYVPEQPSKGIMCASWLFNPELEDFYNRESNLVRYQQELYLFPVHSSGTDGVYFIFDRETVGDPAALPRDTSIRKALAERLASGGVLRNGGMMYLNEDLPKFGAQHYRRQPWVQAIIAGDAAALKRSDIGLLPDAF